MVKPDGGANQTDIQAALASKNGLPLLTLTRQEIADLLAQLEGARTGDTTFADDGTAQDALAEYLNDVRGDAKNAFDQEEGGPTGDERLQQLQFRDGGLDVEDLLRAEEAEVPMTNSDESFGFFQFTNGGTKRFSFDGDRFLVRAAKLFDGDVKSTGHINDVRLADGDGVKLAGRSVGGPFKWDFANRKAAKEFRSFLDELYDAIDETDAVASSDIA